MKNKLLLLFIPGLILIGALSNSCKKDNQNSLETLFTSNSWQLASVRLTISVGDTVKLDTTLNTDCQKTQIFTFNTDKTCTYTNFNCQDQPIAKGNWSISPNQIFLNADMVCKDSTAVGSSKPFSNAQIYNIGQYSLVLLTGDIQNYNTSKRRRVVRYGFIRQKAATQ